MNDAQTFSENMAARGWRYRDLDELCEEHLKMFLESYQILELCEQFRHMTGRAIDALAQERQAHQGSKRPEGPLPWDLIHGCPRPEDLC